MKHLNGNIICALDCETTGLKAGFHDLLEVAVVPLDHNFDPLKDCLPFESILKPLRPENVDPKAMTVNKMDLATCINEGNEPDWLADKFIDWCRTKLKLPDGKKILPLAANWFFDRNFFTEWLGLETFESLFDYHFRDPTAVANFFNDYYAQRAEPVPFSKTSLSYVASQLKIETPRSHRALEDALTAAKVWKELTTKSL